MATDRDHDPARTAAELLGAQLREAREAAGLSLTQLATHVPYSRAALGFYETGARTAPPEVRLWYQRVCGATFDPVSTVSTLGRADVDRRGFLRSVVYSTALSATALTALPAAARLSTVTSARHVGIAEVRAVRAVTDAFLQLDETRGGGIGRTAIAEFLSTDVANLLAARFSDSAARGQAFSAAAELAYLAGFKAHDTGDDAIAQRYYLSALRLAEEAHEPGHDAFALRILALQGIDIRPRASSVDLAEEAVRRAGGQVSPDTEALFVVALARCHAETGNHRQARSVLRRAEPAITPQPAERLPRWAAMWCPTKATLLNQTAATFTALGDHAEAERHYLHSAAIWNPDTHTRIHALTTVDAGTARWRTGDHDGAATIWQPVIPALTAIHSARTAKALAKITKLTPDRLTDV